jgi:hypothetical protein
MLTSPHQEVFWERPWNGLGDGDGGSLTLLTALTRLRAAEMWQEIQKQELP